MTAPAALDAACVDPYDPAATAETFDLDRWLLSFPERLLGRPETRRILTERDPLLFALLYLGHHLRSESTGDRITLSDAHLDWCRQARRWTEPTTEPRADRHAQIAPRDVRKSTWWYLILPLWAAAHGHITFVAAFADSATQAEQHLSTLRRELETNQRLRADYPDLCRPAMRGRGLPVADNRGMWQAHSDFVFVARGIDSSNLGIKVDRRRPDLLLLDDVEPDEASYSATLADKRLGTILDAVLPMNLRARVVLTGTVTMPGSVVHQLVKAGRGEVDDTNRWVVEERFQVHHYQPIMAARDGGERSLWSAKWSMTFLGLIRATRSYLKNFANDPMGRDGDYWHVEDFQYGDLAGVTRVGLWVDPPVTTTARSDPAGIAVVGYVPPSKEELAKARAIADPALRQAAVDAASTGRVVVYHAEEVRLTGTPLARHVIRVLGRFPRVSFVFVESNQGGDLWYEVMDELPVPVRTHTASESKEVRFARTLTFYQYPRRQVWHAERLPAAEQQMVGFPRMAHDDVVDAVCAGVLAFLRPPRKPRTKNRTVFPR